ncbi:hypothetical protein C7475_10724 [Chitinophaga sp. S165]|nr:hypothetical protein C7475_10724 [Chitinophaga sp. S165]
MSWWGCLVDQDDPMQFLYLSPKYFALERDTFHCQAGTYGVAENHRKEEVWLL